MSADTETDDEIPEQRYLEIAKIKIPKTKVRDVDPESKKFKQMKADIKVRGQRDPIKVRTFGSRELTDGLRRLTILGELGYEFVLAVEDDQVEDAQDRILNGLLDNEMREAMTPMELAQSFAILVKGGKYTQKKIAKRMGMSESEVSKLLALVKLPKKVREVIEALPEDSEYSKGVLLEMTTASTAVQTEIAEHMKAGEKVTVADVRAKKKEANKAEGKPDRKKPEDKGSKGITYKRLPSGTVGEGVSATVKGSELELRLVIPWKRKTFKGIDVLKEIKALFDNGFADEETECDSFKAFAEELTAAKSELTE